MILMLILINYYLALFSHSRHSCIITQSHSMCDSWVAHIVDSKIITSVKHAYMELGNLLMAGIGNLFLFKYLNI